MLGAGFVTRLMSSVMQALRYLLVWKKFPVASTSLADLSLACRTLESAKKLSAGVKNAHPISLDVQTRKLSMLKLQRTIWSLA
jgi:saccharopine dehydrogenase (NADP+, L-glutamate forming)